MASTSESKCQNQYCGRALDKNVKITAFCEECEELNVAKQKEVKDLNFVTALLVASWLMVLISFFTDVYNFTDQYNLFGRTGSIVTLLAVVCEFMLSRKLTPNYPFHIKNGLSFGRVGEAIETTIPTKYDNRLSVFFLSSLVVGTMIWGFGDLINL